MRLLKLPMSTKEFKFPEGRTVEHYDDNQLIKIEDFNEDDELQFITTYGYDDLGNNTDRKVTDGDGAQIRRLRLTFDKDGNEISCAEFDDKGNRAN